MPVTPTLDELHQLAGEFNVLPISRGVEHRDLDPVALFEKVSATTNNCFLLESAEAGVWSRYSFIGVKSRGILRKSNAGDVSWFSESGASPYPDGRSLPNFESVLEAIESIGSSWQSPKHIDLPPLTSGLVGHLAWDIIREIENLPKAPQSDYESPLANLSMCSDMIVIDHATSRLIFIANLFVDSDVALESAYSEACARIDSMQALVEQPLATHVLTRGSAQPTHRTSKAAFLASLEQAKQHVIAGDVFQVVLSQRFDVETDASGLEIYRKLRELNPSPYMYLINATDESGAYSIVGSSPEALVTVTDGTAVMHPIAGSRPRGANSHEDDTLAGSLVLDDKEKAEHLMLVDLARNDLLKVCEPTTVHVSEFMQIHKFSHVMHLVSTVEGEVRLGESPVDVFKATFPAGTLSGAPKPRALEIIDDLEPVNRGIYAGVVGYFDFVGNADLAIAIRTAFVRDGVARVQAGAGIVLDSVFENEYQETVSKAGAALKAISQVGE